MIGDVAVDEIHFGEQLHVRMTWKNGGEQSRKVFKRVAADPR
jgi:hypothetical protein